MEGRLVTDVHFAVHVLFWFGMGCLEVFFVATLYYRFVMFMDTRIFGEHQRRDEPYLSRLLYGISESAWRIANGMTVACILAAAYALFHIRCVSSEWGRDRFGTVLDWRWATELWTVVSTSTGCNPMMFSGWLTLVATLMRVYLDKAHSSLHILVLVLAIGLPSLVNFFLKRSGMEELHSQERDDFGNQNVAAVALAVCCFPIFLPSSAILFALYEYEKYGSPEESIKVSTITWILVATHFSLLVSRQQHIPLDLYDVCFVFFVVPLCVTTRFFAMQFVKCRGHTCGAVKVILVFVAALVLKYFKNYF